MSTKRSSNLSSIGVPQDWVEDVRSVTEDAFLALSDHLPGEASEALCPTKSSIDGAPRAQKGDRRDHSLPPRLHDRWNGDRSVSTWQYTFASMQDSPKLDGTNDLNIEGKRKCR